MARLTPPYLIRIQCGHLIKEEDNVLVTLKDIQDMTEYGSILTGYQMLRAADVDPVKYEKVDGKGAPVNWYRKEDVLPVFKERFAKLGKKNT